MAVNNITKKYTLEIDGQPAARSLTSLKAEFKDLQLYLDTVAEGSEDAMAALRRMAEVKDEMGDLRGVIDTLNPDGKIQAFLNMGTAVTGAFEVATVAAESFGLSSGSVEQYEKKVMGLIATLQGLEQIRSALEPQNIKAIKSLFALGEGYTLAGVKAKLFSITTRQAMVATGIGAVIVLVGLLMANFDKVLVVVNKFKERFKPQFEAVSGFIDTLMNRARDLASALTFGLVDNAAKHAKEVAKEAEQERIKEGIASRARRIQELEAAGKETIALRRKNLEEELNLLRLQGKGESEDFKNKATELRALKAAYKQKEADEAEKTAKEQRDKAKAAAEKALKDAEEAFNKRRELERQKDEETHLAREERRNQDYERAKLAGANQQQLLAVEVTNLKDVLNEMLVAGKSGGSEYLAVKNDIREKEKQILELNLADIQEQAEKKRVLQDKELADLDTLSETKLAKLRAEGATNRRLQQEDIKLMQERLVVLKRQGKSTTAEYYNLITAIREAEKELAKSEPALFNTFLGKLLGLDQEKVQSLKQNLNAAITESYSSVSGLASGIIEESIMQYDAQLSILEEKISQLDEQMQEKSDSIEESEKQLDNARGARRDGIIAKITREREEEQKLRAEKAKAAAEQARVAKQKEEAEKKAQQLEETSQKIAAASTVIQATLAGIEAARAVAKAAAAGKVGWDNIAIAIAATAALVAGFAKVKAAIKLEDGGSLEEALAESHEMANVGGFGPLRDSGLIQAGSHASGNDVPIFGGRVRVEGNEFITKASAYAKNREAIEKINAIGDRVKFTVVPESSVQRFAGGGALNPNTNSSVTREVAAPQPSMPSNMTISENKIIEHQQRTDSILNAILDLLKVRPVFKIGEREVELFEEVQEGNKKRKDFSTL